MQNDSFSDKRRLTFVRAVYGRANNQSMLSCVKHISTLAEERNLLPGLTEYSNLAGNLPASWGSYPSAREPFIARHWHRHHHHYRTLVFASAFVEVCLGTEGVVWCDGGVV